LGGEGLGFFLGMVVAEVGMAGDARGAATAAVGEGEQTQGYAVFFTERRHGSLLEFEFLRLLAGSSGAGSGKLKWFSVVSFQFSFREEKATRKPWNLGERRQDAGATKMARKQKRPGFAGAQWSTGIFYRDGTSSQRERSGAMAIGLTG
jgi:hypothetical protein